MSQDLRHHLVELLQGGSAHVTLDQALEGLAAENRGEKADGFPYTIWEVLDHMRLAQWDILEFSRNPAHVSPPWPQGYWPETSAPESDQAWQKSVRALHADLESMLELLRDSSRDLFAPLPHGQGQTLLREALLVADHNAYHVGQIMLLRKILEGRPTRAR